MIRLVNGFGHMGLSIGSCESASTLPGKDADNDAAPMMEG